MEGKRYDPDAFVRINVRDGRVTSGELEDKKEKGGSQSSGGLGLMHLPYARKDFDKLRILANLHKQALVADDTATQGRVRGLARSLFGNRVVRTRITQQIATATVAANTAMASSLPADMALASDITSILNLFDEIRCHEVKCEALVGALSNNTTVALGINVLFGMHFDPIDSTAPTSLNELKNSSIHTDLHPMYQNTGFSFATGNFVTSKFAVQPSNWLHLSSGKLVKDVLPPSSGGVLAPSPIGGNWVPTASAALVVGYFKLYGEDPQTNDLSWMYRAFMHYDIELRFRG
jgi:hypothetical protein